MGLSSVTDRLGGKQAKRAIDLVDELWDNRKRIVEMVDFVWDRRDAITSAIDFVQEHQERIADVVGRLPELVGTAGIGLEAAGSGAQRASLLLTSDDENGPQVLSAAAADALERCREQLGDVATLLAELGEGLDRVRIPTISAERAEVMGFSLISGVDIGERPLLDVAAKRVEHGSESLTDVAEQLGDVAQRFRSLGAHLADVGGDLGDTGEQLTDSGGTLRSFVTDMPDAAVGEGGRGRTPTKKRRPTKKTASKKQATKKQATKKRTPGKKNTAKKTATKKRAPSKKTASKKRSSKKRPTKQRSTIVPEG